MIKNNNFLNFNGNRIYYKDNKFYMLKKTADNFNNTIFVNGDKYGCIVYEKLKTYDGKVIDFTYEPVFVKPGNFDTWISYGNIEGLFRQNNINPDNFQYLINFDNKILFPKTLNDLHKIITPTKNIHRHYTIPKYDCDDYSFKLNVYAKHWGCNGIMICGVEMEEGYWHVINVTFTNDSKIVFIEPQNNNLYFSMEEYKIKKIIGVIQ